MPSACYSLGTLCQPYTKSQKSRAMAGLLISAAVSPSSCPLYTWFHRDHSAHCNGICSLTRLLPLRECRLWAILRFLFPFVYKTGREMDRNNMWDCNMGCYGSPWFLFFPSKVALAAHICCASVIFSHSVTQHSSKVQVMIFAMKMDFVFLPIHLSV